MTEKICYKIVRENSYGELFSMIINKGVFCYEYKIGEWTETKFPKYGILVFRKKSQARMFRCDKKNFKSFFYHIYECEYDREIILHDYAYIPILIDGCYFAMQKCYPEPVENMYPAGTFSVNRIKLLREVK